MKSIDAAKREKDIYRVTFLGSIGNFCLLLFKFVAGIVGHSAAMIADAAHSLSDFVTDVIVIIFVKISSKPSDPEHQYGHGKYETLATTIIAMMLFGVGIGIFWKSAEEIIAFCRGDELEAPGMIAFVAAVLSIVVKEGLYRLTLVVAKRCDSKVVEANAWHHRSDALSSIGAALGIGGAMFFGVKARVLDPLAAAIVSLFIMRVAVMLIKPAVEELVEHSLPEETERQILEAVTECAEVSQPHNLRTRRIGNRSAVEVHVRMDPNMTVAKSHDITRLIEARIKRLLGSDTYVNIHVEPNK